MSGDDRSGRRALEADRAARWAAQVDFERPLVLQAGAGTGKTTTLVSRILCWCLGRGWDRAAGSVAQPGARPHEIAIRVLEGVEAITFTEAAAAQMASRVAESLALIAAGREADLPGFEPMALPASLTAAERRGRARALLGALDHLNARTIHAFALSVLSSHPLEAGLHPHLTVDADGSSIEEISEEVVARELGRARADRAAPFLLLARRRVGPREIAETVAGLALRALPASALRDERTGAAWTAATRRRLAAAVDQLVQAAAGAFELFPRRSLAYQIGEALASTGSLLEPRGEQPQQTAGALVGQLREAWSKVRLERLESWSRGSFKKAESARFAGRGREIGEAAGRLGRLLSRLCDLDPELLEAGRRALEPLLAEVESETRARGVIGFNGLLLEAWRLLAGHPGVARGLRRRIDQLLVDEFQDTDRLQCDIVRLLGLEGPAAERPGLFVVGDPQQSIFGWRDADLEAYADFVDQARRAGGETHTLTRSFRSGPVILGEVERVVAGWMRSRRGLQPDFTPLVPSDDPRLAAFADEPRAPIEYWVSWEADDSGRPRIGRQTRADEAAAIEAAAVAADIRSLHDLHGVPWRSCAVLLRTSNRLDTFLRALREAEVPFAVGKDKEYYRRREIIEAAALVRAVINPCDHLALVTLLRSAAVGVPDAALIPLWARGFPGLATDLGSGKADALPELGRMVEEVAGSLPAGIPGLDRIHGWELGLLAALENLADLRRSFARDPADRFIERLRRLFLLEVTEAARYLGRFRLANLERLFRSLEQAVERSGGDVGAILRSLKRSVAEAREAEEARPKEAIESAVQVLTIHGAKGLQFDHVYLVQLHAEPGKAARPTLDVDERWPSSGTAIEYRVFGAASPGFHTVEERREAIAAAEQVRTLYVAMTRARRRLVLAGNWPTTAASSPGSEPASHLDLVRARAPRSLAELWDASREGGGDHADHGGVRWRFPALAPRPSGPRQARRPPSWLPAATAVETQAERLAALAPRAAARMERAFGAAASDEAAARLEQEFLEVAPHEDAVATVPTPGGAAARRRARAVGSAIHHVLETWELEASPGSELGRQRRLLAAYLGSRLSAAEVAAALPRARALLDRLARGSALRRLRRLGSDLLARELPLLLPPVDTGAVAFTAGVIDLLYRDPESGELVVADYKTDEIESEEAIAARAHAYSAQGALYTGAVRDALDLGERPRFELWFLWPDRVWRSPR